MSEEQVNVPEIFEPGMSDDEIAERARLGIVGIYDAAHAVVQGILAQASQATEGRIEVKWEGVAKNMADMPYGDLARMASSARAYLEAFAIVQRWHVPGDGKTLGNLLKVIPADEAAEVHRLMAICTESN